MKNTRFSLSLKTFAALAVTAVMALGCTDNFYDWNENEDNYDKLNIGNLFMQMQDNVLPIQENKYQHNESLLGHIYGRYLAHAKSQDWTTNFQRFNASTAWLDSPFDNVMTAVYQAWSSIKEISEGEGVYYDLAQVLRVAAMQRLSDMYGPLPYSEISKGTGSLKVAYDSQEDLYKYMLVDLSAAIANLNTFNIMYPGDKAIAEFDQVYGGDLSKWVLFANSLKLRMAVRIVYADNELAKTCAREAIEGGVMADNSDNASIFTRNNPLYVMGYPYNDCRASAEMMSYMKGYKDPRIGAYFNKGKFNEVEDYYGVRIGYVTNASLTENTSRPNVRMTDDLLWMPASEVAFLKAECVYHWGGEAQGWMNMGMSLKDLYEEGIRLSFIQNDCSTGQYEAYVNGNAAPVKYEDPNGTQSINAATSVTVKWNDSASDEVKLERLMIQKWLALYPLGTEAWSDHRRTGYPKFFHITDVQNSDAMLSVRGASRIPFPPSEQVNNSDNYNAAVTMLGGGGDKYGTRLWWDKKAVKPYF